MQNAEGRKVLKIEKKRRHHKNKKRAKQKKKEKAKNEGMKEKFYLLYFRLLSYIRVVLVLFLVLSCETFVYTLASLIHCSVGPARYLTLNGYSTLHSLISAFAIPLQHT